MESDSDSDDDFNLNLNQQHDYPRLKRRRIRSVCTGCGDTFVENYLPTHQKLCPSAYLTDSQNDLDEMAHDDDQPENRNAGDSAQPPTCSFFRDSDSDSDNVRRGHILKMAGQKSTDSGLEHSDRSRDQQLTSDSDSDHDIDNPFVPSSSEDEEICANESASNIARMCASFLGQWQVENNVTDTATESLLKFQKDLFRRLDHTETASVFPGSMYKFDKMLEVKNDFKRYVVCKECLSLYDYDECWCLIEGGRQPKNCPYVPWPDHTQEARRAACKSPLLKLKEEEGEIDLIPHYTFLYNSVEKTLSEMLMRPEYEEMCKLWKTRDPDAYMQERQCMSDIYDGKIWKQFERDGRFESELSFGLVLNVDWFGPFKHSPDSIGCMYLVNANLPRTERYKIENTLIVGIIPDMPKEPQLNTFLKPLVEELLASWDNKWKMCTFSQPQSPRPVKAFLVCTGADVPAARKLCGFLSHCANQGCTRCKKTFPGPPGEKNYSGFDRDCEGTDWKRRTNTGHRDECMVILQAVTKTARRKLETEYGTRRSVLLDLPYYQPINMCTIDPMHNLYLGTAKHMISVWKDNRLLSDSDCLVLQQRVDLMKVPSDMGKIPKKIGSKFSKLTADEWKNWTLYFSCIALKGVIPRVDLECWRKFVLACRIFHSRMIRMEDVRKADSLMLDFCQTFERLYGEKPVTPNMHLGCHLADVVADYGPIHSFWLFPFERFNGILGAKKTNKKNVPVQLMKKILRYQQMYRLSSDSGVGNQRGTLKDMAGADITAGVYENIVEKSDMCSPVVSNWERGLQFYECPKEQIKSLNHEDLRCLSEMYNVLYGESGEVTVTGAVRMFDSLTLFDETIGTHGSRSKRSSLIRAFWTNADGKINEDFFVTDTPWPGRVNYIIGHSVLVNGVWKKHVLACVNWFAPVDENTRYSYGISVELWKKKIYVPCGPSKFIPVQRIRCKFIECSVHVGRRSYVAVVSRNRLTC